MATVAAGGEGLLPVDRAGDLVPLTRQVEGEGLAQGAVVFDDQDRPLQFRSSTWPVAR
jgi:hypothetical protein